MAPECERHFSSCPLFPAYLGEGEGEGDGDGDGLGLGDGLHDRAESNVPLASGQRSSCMDTGRDYILLPAGAWEERSASPINKSKLLPRCCHRRCCCRGADRTSAAMLRFARFGPLCCHAPLHCFIERATHLGDGEGDGDGEGLVPTSLNCRLVGSHLLAPNPILFELPAGIILSQSLGVIVTWVPALSMLVSVGPQLKVSLNVKVSFLHSTEAGCRLLHVAHSARKG